MTNSELYHCAVCPYPVESDAFSDGQMHRGMDRYLDSLFDPVLSDSSIVSTDMDHMVNTLALQLYTCIYIIITSVAESRNTVTSGSGNSFRTFQRFLPIFRLIAELIRLEKQQVET